MSTVIFCNKFPKLFLNQVNLSIFGYIYFGCGHCNIIIFEIYLLNDVYISHDTSALETTRFLFGDFIC